MSEGLSKNDRDWLKRQPAIDDSYEEEAPFYHATDEPMNNGPTESYALEEPIRRKPSEEKGSLGISEADLRRSLLSDELFWKEIGPKLSESDLDEIMDLVESKLDRNEEKNA